MFWEKAKEKPEKNLFDTVVLVGSSGAGKSTFLQAGLKKKGVVTVTIGIDFERMDVTCKDGSILKLNVWDTAGQEKFHSISRSYYTKANLFVLVIDLSNMWAYNDVRYWSMQIAQYGPKNTPVLFVGNKSDLPVAVDREKIKRQMHEVFSAETHVSYIECSAITGEGIDNAFVLMAEDILVNKINKQSNEVNTHSINSGISLASSDPEEPRPAHCCGF